MKITSSEFVISNSNYKKCPSQYIPEYAFVGRSNVGKSSLINALTNTKGLAKTSSKPGKTQLINHFLINKSWFLVDLPGYGYAKISKTKRLEFKKMTHNYLTNRLNLMCLFVLIDCRHKPQVLDLEFMQNLAVNKIPFCIIFTKSDKISKVMLEKQVESYKNHMLKEWESLPIFFTSSAVKKTGLTEVKNFIFELNQKFNPEF